MTRQEALLTRMTLMSERSQDVTSQNQRWEQVTTISHINSNTTFKHTLTQCTQHTQRMHNWCKYALRAHINSQKVIATVWECFCKSTVMRGVLVYVVC